jgi:hypothetical protein
MPPPLIRCVPSLRGHEGAANAHSRISKYSLARYSTVRALMRTQRHDGLHNRRDMTTDVDSMRSFLPLNLYV